MDFTKELLSNKIFKASDLSYDVIQLKKKVVTDAHEMSLQPGNGDIYPAAELQTDGSYVIRMYAPDAKEIKLVPWFGDPTPEGYAPWRDTPIYMEKGANGVFTAVMAFDERKTGPRNIDVFIDGTFVIWPFLPIYWSGGKPWNFLEVPDNDLAFSYIKDVPHGSVSENFYFSKATGEFERCLVYTPPGYMNGTESYPVLYLQHGGGENETVWTSAGRVNFIMDNLLAEGQCVPFIIVMNNSIIRYPDTPDGVNDSCFEDSLIESCIPYIERTYRVKTGKWNRAIAGLSMSSMLTNDIGFKHPDLFGNMGSFTSTMYHTDFKTTYERPWPKVMAEPEKFMENYKVFFCSATPQEDHINFFLKDAEIMREAGIEGKMPGYRRVIHDGRFIRWDSWRMGMRDFASMLFRD